MLGIMILSLIDGERGNCYDSDEMMAVVVVPDPAHVVVLLLDHHDVVLG